MWLLLWVLVGGAYPPQSRWDMNIHASSLAPRGAALPLPMGACKAYMRSMQLCHYSAL